MTNIRGKVQGKKIIEPTKNAKENRYELRRGKQAEQADNDYGKRMKLARIKMVFILLLIFILKCKLAISHRF